MNFNDTNKISPTQLIKGGRGFNEFRWPSRLGLAEDGMSKAKRPGVRQPTSFTAPGYSTSGSPGPRGHLEFGPPRFNLGRRRAVNYLVSENTNVNNK